MPRERERTVSRSLSALQAILLGVVVLVGGGLIAAAVFAVGSRQWFGSRTLTVCPMTTSLAKSRSALPEAPHLPRSGL